MEVMTKKELIEFLMDRIDNTIKGGEGEAYLQFGVWNVTINKAKGRGNGKKYKVEEW